MPANPLGFGMLCTPSLSQIWPVDRLFSPFYTLIKSSQLQLPQQYWALRPNEKEEQCDVLCVVLQVRGLRSMRHLKIAYSSMHVMSQSTSAYVPTINVYCDQVSKVGGHHGNLNLLFNTRICCSNSICCSTKQHAILFPWMHACKLASSGCWLIQSHFRPPQHFYHCKPIILKMHIISQCR